MRLVIIGDELSKYPEVRRAVIQGKIVFPSLYEGFGLPPLEAMACGAPVVTSNSSSLPEVVGEAAMIVNPENVFDIARGIREVLLDEGLRRQTRAIAWGRDVCLQPLALVDTSQLRN